jgi:hypothetical protein
LVGLSGHKSAFCLTPRVSDPLKTDWQRHVLACSGLLNWECSMTRRRSLKRLSQRIRAATRSWAHPLTSTWQRGNGTWQRPLPATLLSLNETCGSIWPIRFEGSRLYKKRKPFCCGQAIHPKVAMIAFSLACYASVTGRMEEAKVRLRHAITLDKDIRGLAIDDEDLRPLWDWIAGLK